MVSGRKIRHRRNSDRHRASSDNRQAGPDSDMKEMDINNFYSNCLYNCWKISPYIFPSFCNSTQSEERAVAQFSAEWLIDNILNVLILLLRLLDGVGYVRSILMSMPLGAQPKMSILGQYRFEKLVWNRCSIILAIGPIRRKHDASHSQNRKYTTYRKAA